MKKHVPLIVAGVSIVLTLLIGIGQYNGLTNSQLDVESAQSKVDANLQRRHDLTPNVVSSVKGYMKHESDIFTDIADARAKIGSSSEAIKNEGERELDSAVSRLLVSVENYPELKANEQVKGLIIELEGTENRIYVSRTDYNAVATAYNKKIRKFPSNIFAKMFGFERVDLFEAEKTASEVPSVNLD